MKYILLLLFWLATIVSTESAEPISPFLVRNSLSPTPSIQLVNFQQASPEDKDVNRAFIQSLILPGMGQVYTESKRGYAWLGAEVALLVSYVIIHRQARQLKSDYVQGVKDGVAFDGPTKFDQWNMEDFEHATMYDNWYNVYNESNGEPSHPRIGKWYWKDRKEFKTQNRKDKADSPTRVIALQARKDSNLTYERARTVLGLLILNHVASAIDARISAKIFNKKHQLGHHIRTGISPKLATEKPQIEITKRVVFRF